MLPITPALIRIRRNRAWLRTLAAFGRAFEHFILMELLAHRSYRELDHDVRFWRTKSGLEVDYVLGDGEIAIEVKAGRRVDAAELRPLEAFVEEH